MHRSFAMKLCIALSIGTPAMAADRPAAPIAPPADIAGSSLLAADTETAWVAFDLTPGNQIRFALTLDGHALTAILDTGVSYSLLARASMAADHAMVRPGGSAAAIGGAVAIGWLPIRALVIGGLTRTGGGVSVADLPAVATGSAVAVDMLVGRDVLGGEAIDIDYANRRFRLLPSGRMPFRGFVAPLSIPASRNVYESEIALDGQRLRPVVVDTGDGSAITLSAAAWRASGPHGEPETSAISFGLAGPIVSALAVVPAVSIGDLVARSVEVRIEPPGGFSESIGTAGRIGSGFLQNYRVLLDPGAGRMVLGPGPHADEQPLRSTSGLLVGIEPTRLRVLHVMRGGPAAADGWLAGDEICAVDGTTIGPGYATGPLVAWSVGTPGRQVALTLCDGTVRTLALRRFY